MRKRWGIVPKRPETISKLPIKQYRKNRYEKDNIMLPVTNEKRHCTIASKNNSCKLFLQRFFRWTSFPLKMWVLENCFFLLQYIGHCYGPYPTFLLRITKHHWILSCLSERQDVEVFRSLLKSDFLLKGPLSVHCGPSFAVSHHMFQMHWFSRPSLSQRIVQKISQTQVPRYAALSNGGCPRRLASLVSWGMYQAQGSSRVEVWILYDIFHNIMKSMEMLWWTVNLV